MKKSMKTHLMHVQTDDYDLFAYSNEDDDRMRKLKTNFMNLELYEKNLMLIYIKSDYNINAMAKMFNIRWSTMQKYIKNIREKIL